MPQQTNPARRSLWARVAVLSAVAPLSRGLAAPARVAATGRKTKIKVVWNQTALCTSAVPITAGCGIFDTHNLDVEQINFGGSRDLLLEATGNGHADAGIGMT